MALPALITRSSILSHISIDTTKNNKINQKQKVTTNELKQNRKHRNNNIKQQNKYNNLQENFLTKNKKSIWDGNIYALPKIEGQVAVD